MKTFLQSLILALAFSLPSVVHSQDPVPADFAKAVAELPDAFKTEKYEKGEKYKITGKLTEYFQIVQVVDGVLLIGDSSVDTYKIIAILVPANPDALETINVPSLNGGSHRTEAAARSYGAFAGFNEIELTTGPTRLPTFVITGLETLYTKKFIELE